MFALCEEVGGGGATCGGDVGAGAPCVCVCVCVCVCCVLYMWCVRYSLVGGLEPGGSGSWREAECVCWLFVGAAVCLVSSFAMGLVEACGQARRAVETGLLKHLDPKMAGTRKHVYIPTKHGTHQRSLFRGIWFPVWFHVSGGRVIFYVATKWAVKSART